MARTPKYCLHKPSGRGYARFPRGGGKYDTLYFPGPHNSPESYAAYVAALAEWRSKGTPPAPIVPTSSLTVLQLTVLFIGEVRAGGLYTKGGRKTSEHHCLAAAFRALNAEFANLPAADFALAHVEKLRLAMIARGWADKTVRAHLSRVRGLFGWAEEAGYVGAKRLVRRKGLGVKRPPRGRLTAKITRPDPYSVGAVAVYLGPPVCSMLWLQRLNGIRSAGICELRPCDVDRSAPIWTYTEPSHAAAKTGREVHRLGPRAQAVLRPYLESVPSPSSPIFCPPNARSRDRYTVAQYRRRVEVACTKLGVPHFHPHQLRHWHAWEVRRAFGIEAARARLSHSQVEMTEHYAELDSDLAARVAREIG